MKYDELTIFRISIAVAIGCTAFERPKSENQTPEDAAEYIRDVLKVVFSNTGMDISVKPLAYPPCNKVPLVITLNGADQRLFWYYPYADQGDLAIELEGALHDIIKDSVCVPA